MPAPAETLPRPEQAAERFRPLRGAQVRFVLADQTLLDPNKPCPDEAFTQTKTFQDRDYGIFERASVADRKDYWEQRNLSGQEAKRAWTEKTQATFNRAKNTSRFQSLSPLLATLGLDINKEAFDAGDIEKIWQRYFAKGDNGEPGGVRRFTQDILEGYQSNGQIDKEKVAQAMEGIAWFSNLFGEKGGEVVTQLIDAEVGLQTDATFVEQHKEKANALTEKEKELLAFLAPHREGVLPRRDQNREDENQTQGEYQISKHAQEIKEKIEHDDSVVVVGGTGSGKTMGIPPMIRSIMKPGDKLIVTQPRQINTSDLATNVAKMEGVVLGEEIGYQHGGGSKFSPEKTDTLFTTEGTLILKILEDPLLSGITHVMVDEVHVRSTDTEQLLRYLKEAQRLRKERGLPPLKIIAASATVDKEELADYLNVPHDKIVDVEGERKHAIEKRYAARDIDSRQMPQAAADAVATISQSGDEGDIMIFVAGTGDIESTVAALQAKNLANTRFIKLHANSDESEKDEAMKPPTPGTRRVIVATNFAETGLTIKGLKYVINTGEEYERTVDPVSGLEYIKKIEQSQAGCLQRDGRVGRMSPGIVINLFTETNYRARRKYPMPEIKRTDLTDLVLKMKKRGIQNFADFKVLSGILDERRMAFANESLQKLGATNPDGTLTHIGERMIELPIDIHLARMIAAAEKNNRGIEQMCTITALVDTRALFLNDGINRLKAQQTRQQFKNQNSDYLTYLAIWEEFERNGESEVWAADHGLNFQKLLQVKVSRDRLISRSRGRRDVAATSEELEQYVVAGLKDRVMEYNAGRRSYVWGRSNVVNLNLQIGNQSALHTTNPQYIVAQDNSELRGGTNPVYVTNCQRVKPEWL